MLIASLTEYINIPFIIPLIRTIMTNSASENRFVESFRDISLHLDYFTMILNGEIEIKDIPADEMLSSLVRMLLNVNSNDERRIKVLMRSLHFFRYLEDPSIEIWRFVLQKDGFFLKHMEIGVQTNELCLIAVKNSGYAIEFVQNKTQEICEAAVQQNGNCIKHIPNPNRNICLLAVKNGCVLMNIPRHEIDEEICLISVMNNGFNLQDCPIQTDKICYAAIQNQPCALRYVNRQNYQICEEAVALDCDALYHAKFQTYDMCLAAVKEKAELISAVKEQYRTPELLALINR